MNAQPIMNAPLLATSLSDFWGKRWNLAFRDLAHAHVFRPVVKKAGKAVATMAVFLVSGVVHDAAISTSARAGYGLPTLYFLIQGLALLWERSEIGKQLGIRKGMMGRMYGALIVLGPLGLLFPQSFVERVVVPMLRTMGNAADGL